MLIQNGYTFDCFLVVVVVVVVLVLVFLNVDLWQRYVDLLMFFFGYGFQRNPHIIPKHLPFFVATVGILGICGFVSGFLFELLLGDVGIYGLVYGLSFRQRYVGQMFAGECVQQSYGLYAQALFQQKTSILFARFSHYQTKRKSHINPTFVPRGNEIICLCAFSDDLHNDYHLAIKPWPAGWCPPCSSIVFSPKILPWPGWICQPAIKRQKDGGYWYQNFSISEP